MFFQNLVQLHISLGRVVGLWTVVTRLFGFWSKAEDQEKNIRHLEDLLKVSGGLGRKAQGAWGLLKGEGGYSRVGEGGSGWEF